MKRETGAWVNSGILMLAALCRIGIAPLLGDILFVWASLYAFFRGLREQNGSAAIFSVSMAVYFVYQIIYGVAR